MTTSPPVIDQLPIDQLIPYAGNARRHPPEQTKQIADSIQRLGFLNPILLDPAGVIIAGHGRYEAAKRLGLRTVPVIRLSGLTDEQTRRLRIEDNALAAASHWDIPALLSEVDRLADSATSSLLRIFEHPGYPFLSGEAPDESPPVGRPSVPAPAEGSDAPRTLEERPPACAIDRVTTVVAPELPSADVPRPSRLPALERPAVSDQTSAALLDALARETGLSADELLFLRASADRRVSFCRSAICGLARDISLPASTLALLSRCGILPVPESL